MLAQYFITATITVVSAANAEHDWSTYINPFIGTEGTVPGTSFNGGNVFPGAVVPFGSVKLGPDTNCLNTSIDVNAGYTPDGNVTSFSMLHVSGTGGGPIYGVVSQMPLTSLDGVNVLDNLTYMQPRTARDVAKVGYYKSSLLNGVTVEMSATSHTGIIQYNLPGKSEAHIVVDVSHYLPLNGGYSQGQFYSNGEITVSKDGQRYSGYGVYRGGFSGISSYQVFYCGEFDSVPKSTRTFQGPSTDPYWPTDWNEVPVFGSESTISGGHVTYQFGDRVGGIFTFDSSITKLKSRIGISWISTEKACKFLVDEMPHWDLNKTVREAVDVWNTEVLSKITTTDLANQTRLTMFYTALYHSALMPTDRTGENPHWKTSEPSYDDFYTLWDTFRCLNSLILLILPDRATGMIRSLIDIWRHEKFMPDGRSGNSNGQVQGGSNADNVLADAYVKGLRHGINWTDGYLAMRTNAEVTPYNSFDVGDPTCSVKEGRGALPDWLSLGWVSPAYYRSISRTIEYALNDFSVAQVAKDLDAKNYNKYLKRSAGWQYLWQHDLTSLNYTGFLAPRYGGNKPRDKSFDPTKCGSCEGDGISYEALPWEYSWTVPFDMETLISFMGGPEITESRLDAMFLPGGRTSAVGGQGTNGIGDTLYNPGNEPSFSTPLLYNYLRCRQWKSVLRSRQIVNQYYNDGRFGLPGNSDSGAIDSWMIWQMLGLYPVVTQPVYLITSPWFSDITMELPLTNSKLRITAIGLSDKSYYVQSLKVNGAKWNKSWLSHDDIAQGATLEFTLGEHPAEWDTGDLPPSPGHVVIDADNRQ